MVSEPVDERPRRKRLQYGLGKGGQGIEVQRLQRQPLEQSFLLEGEVYPRGGLVLGELARPGRSEDEQPLVPEVAGEVVDPLPG